MAILGLLTPFPVLVTLETTADILGPTTPHRIMSMSYSVSAPADIPSPLDCEPGYPALSHGHRDCCTAIAAVHMLSFSCTFFNPAKALLAALVKLQVKIVWGRVSVSLVKLLAVDF